MPFTVIKNNKLLLDILIVSYKQSKKLYKNELLTYQIS